MDKKTRTQEEMDTKTQQIGDALAKEMQDSIDSGFPIVAFAVIACDGGNRKSVVGNPSGASAAMQELLEDPRWRPFVAVAMLQFMAESATQASRPDRDDNKIN